MTNPPKTLLDLLHSPDDSDEIRRKGSQHYQGSIQPWDAMEEWMPPHQFVGFLRGNIIKYLARIDRRGQPLNDARKALHYAEKLVDYMEEHCGPDGDSC